MKCINCGVEIKSDYKVCPFCGKTIQIVPDYSVYDEDDINIILESTKDVNKKKELAKEEREARIKARQKAAEEAKKRKTKLTIAVVLISCVLLIVFGCVAKVFIDKNKGNSYEDQMKQGDSAMFSKNIEEAEKCYLKALELKPEDINVRLELADLYIEKEDTAKAEKLLKEVIERDSINYDAYRMLYDIYSEADDKDAILKLKEGVKNNKILAIFSEYSVDTPVISMEGGTFKEDIKLTISAKKKVEIYYNTEGLDPRENGTKYTGAFELKGEGIHTVKAVTKNELGVYSSIVTETFVIKYEVPEDPVVNPTGGTFDKETYIYLTIPSGCTAYYTWDRTDPTEESSKYVSPILIPEGENVFSVIIINDETGLTSGIYRSKYKYTPAETEIDSDADVEE